MRGVMYSCEAAGIIRQVCRAFFGVAQEIRSAAPLAKDHNALEVPLAQAHTSTL
jgi:hypothetical protein